jgi:hypothetical protein
VQRHPPVRIKDSPCSQRFQKERNMTSEFKNTKIFTLAQSWSKCMTSLSYGMIFDLATWHDASRPLLSLPSTTKAYVDGRMKERQS